MTKPVSNDEMIAMILNSGYKVFLHELYLNNRLRDGETMRQAVGYIAPGADPGFGQASWQYIYEQVAIKLFFPTQANPRCALRYSSTVYGADGKIAGTIPSCTTSELRVYCGWLGEKLLGQADEGKLIEVSATFETENGQATWTVSKL